MKETTKTKIFKLVSAIAITQLAGIIGSIFTIPSISTWYATLQKPMFNPPNWIFGPAWTALYLLMGISFYFVWGKGSKKKISKIALYAFSFQLSLNTVWSILFFGLHKIFYSFAEIIFLWISIAVTIIAFYEISKKAAWLLVPYLAWVSFATILNFAVWQLNMI